MRYLPCILLVVVTTALFAGETPDIWKPVAKKVCAQVNQAVDFYQKGDIKNAHLYAIMSYFKGYDAEIEPAVRVTLGGPYVFSVERQFRDFAAKMTPHPDKKKLQQSKDAAKLLCAEMNKEAEALNASHVKRTVFKVE